MELATLSPFHVWLETFGIVFVSRDRNVFVEVFLTICWILKTDYLTLTLKTCDSLHYSGTVKL